jgi:hypothetical protein
MVSTAVSSGRVVALDPRRQESAALQGARSPTAMAADHRPKPADGAAEGV